MPMTLRRGRTAAPKTIITPVSLLDRLPAEVRLMIYHALLRPDLDSYADGAAHPDWKTAAGCIKVLVLNKQIYEEAIGLLRQMSPILDITWTYRATGKFPPLKVGGEQQLPYHRRRMSLSDEYSRLSVEIVKLARLTLRVFNFHTHSALLGQLSLLIPCSLELREITVDYVPRVSDETDIMLHAEKFRDHARWHDFLTTAERHGIAIVARLGNGANAPSEYFPYSRPLSYLGQLFGQQVIETFNNLESVPKAKTAMRTSIVPSTTYRLTPECRSCGMVFVIPRDLDHHLSVNAHHRVKFMTDISKHSRWTKQELWSRDQTLEMCLQL
ncbi:uncharacterized protein HMPREF1541_02195 [Cyphellophora europaea CBS 101466]|uniref:C2H2-type domain-containing protein n=1 Tax=Cyphellophora europaea (strain CBS 101466) TaxID=1220924 RepID=W2S2X0_CYPE1|nr:uncharacterized protein HMPREF1541_02195 [Cyphellophora europaea CBS 101466]ETN43037.1 hypothetical protein HMPREF1541_02195 [Cyphellophora europaea CBS 101466]